MSMPKLCLQLYSIRDLMAKNPEEALSRVREMNYEAVELAGFYGHTSEDFSKMIEAAGLKVCGSHVGADFLDHPAKTLDEHAPFKMPTIVIPYMNAPEGAKVGDWWKAQADRFNEVYDTCAKYGIAFGYHNHQHEFKTKCEDGRCAWEVFCERLRPEILLEMDVGHVRTAGEDPVAWMQKFPGRYRIYHAKEVYGPGATGIMEMPPQGQPGVNWDSLCVQIGMEGKTEFCVVEVESNPGIYEYVSACARFWIAKGL